MGQPDQFVSVHWVDSSNLADRNRSVAPRFDLGNLNPADSQRGLAFDYRGLKPRNDATELRAWVQRLGRKRDWIDSDFDRVEKDPFDRPVAVSVFGKEQRH